MIKNAALSLDDLCIACHETAKEKGFWDSNRSDGETIALIHSELSELLESLRNGNPESKKLPGISSAEEELADTIIRIFDFSGAHNFNLGKAVLAKMSYNQTRPRLHGKKF